MPPPWIPLGLVAVAALAVFAVRDAGRCEAALALELRQREPRSVVVIACQRRAGAPDEDVDLAAFAPCTLSPILSE